MHITRLRRYVGMAAVLTTVLLLGAACSDDDDDDASATATATETGIATETATATEPAAAASEPLRAAVLAIEDSGVSGRVTLAAGGDGTQVEVSLSGLPVGAHANHLHHGSCAAQGEVHVPLTELDASDEGTAAGSTTFDDPALDHFAAGHYYAVHDADGAVIGCGDVVAADAPLGAVVASDDGSISGSVSLTLGDAGTAIAVDLAGLPEGLHANHIHHGSCANQGEVHVPLTELDAPADGTASASTTADGLDLAHFSVGHYYAVHEAGDDTVGAVIACGDVVAAGSSLAAALPNGVAVSGTDFAFTVSGDFVPGTNEITFSNDGEQVHHLQLMSLGSGNSVEDLIGDLAAAEESGGPFPDYAAFVGGVGQIVPGAQGGMVGQLESGSYALLCFVPDTDGVPHFAKGMAASIEVSGDENAADLPDADLTVLGTEYGFSGDITVAAGEVVLAFTNESGSQEPHEANVFKLADGMTVEEFLAILTAEGDEAAPAGPPPFAPVGGAQAVLPGDTTLAKLDLEAGNYALICFVPNAEGAPHFALGMVAALTVE